MRLKVWSDTLDPVAALDIVRGHCGAIKPHRLTDWVNGKHKAPVSLCNMAIRPVLDLVMSGELQERENLAMQLSEPRIYQETLSILRRNGEVSVINALDALQEMTGLTITSSRWREWERGKLRPKVFTINCCLRIVITARIADPILAEQIYQHIVLL